MNNQNNKFCLMSNLVYFINMNRLYVNEEHLSVMMGIYGFIYKKDEIPFERLKGVNGNFDELFSRISSLLGIIMKKYVTYQSNEYLKKIAEELECKHSVITWINDYYNPYSIYYHKERFFRPIVVTSINQNYIQVYDNKIINYEKRDWIKLTNDKEQRFSIYTMKENNQNFDDIDRVFLFQKGIDYMVNQFYSSGIGMLDKFGVEISNIQDSKKLYEYYFSIKRPGGIVYSRTKLACICMNPLIDKCIFHKRTMCKKSKELAYKWKMLANLMFRLSQQYSKQLHCGISQRLEEIIKYEIELWSLFM